MGPASKRAQKYCKVNLDPSRGRPIYESDDDIQPPPYPPELMKTDVKPTDDSGPTHS